jgi:PleD family two-component response regulator
MCIRDRVTNLKSNEILKTADDRLLRAKFFGRNLIVGSSEIPEELGLAG